MEQLRKLCHPRSSHSNRQAWETVVGGIWWQFLLVPGIGQVKTAEAIALAKPAAASMCFEQKLDCIVRSLRTIDDDWRYGCAFTEAAKHDLAATSGLAAAV